MTEPSDTAKPVHKFSDAYHQRQWAVCYESTRAFYDFLFDEGVLAAETDAHVVDLCSGSGANLFWLKQRCPQLRLTGLEIDPDLVAFGNHAFAERGVTDAQLLESDVYAIDGTAFPKADGVIALQTISWLPDEVGFVKAAAQLNADWIALTGLMIEGSHSFRTMISNHDDPAHGDNAYNTFALSYVQALLTDAGYGAVVSQPFEIGIDLAKPADGGLGTYTETTADGRRLQVSGALMMNWRFLLARRD